MYLYPINRLFKTLRVAYSAWVRSLVLYWATLGQEALPVRVEIAELKQAIHQLRIAAQLEELSAAHAHLIKGRGVVEKENGWHVPFTAEVQQCGGDLHLAAQYTRAADMLYRRLWLLERGLSAPEI